MPFSIDFSTIFNIFARFGVGAPPPEHPTNPYFQNCLNFSLHFRENFDKILKKSQNFQKNFQKIIKFSSLKNAKFLLSPMKKVSPQRDHCSRDLPPSAKSCINYCKDSGGLIKIFPKSKSEICII